MQIALQLTQVSSSAWHTVSRDGGRPPRPAKAGFACRHPSLVHRHSRRSLLELRRSRQSASPSSDAGMLTALKESEAADRLLDVLLACKSQDELAQTVADNVLALDQKWWLRLATRNDAATSPEEKQRLSSLASTVMTMMDAIIKASDKDISRSADILQSILTAAADSRGEWHLPLSAESLAAMEAVMDANAEHVNEALLSYAYAWLRKAHDDKIPGVIELLQRFLQLYAARALVSPTAADAGEAALNAVLAADPAQWRQVVREQLAGADAPVASFAAALQKRVEGLMLLPSSSYTQRVRAEYLTELKEIWEEFAKEL